MIEKIVKHFILITKHKLMVFKFCIIAGIPLRGFMHDWSKYTPVEFFESAKYYTGTGSPINLCRKENGYSKAWQHHKGHNPHHYEYWIDNIDKGGTPLVIPYKYALEMVCDMLAAGKVYMKDTWTKDYPSRYWTEQRDKRLMHPSIKKFITIIYIKMETDGIKSALNHKYTKEVYNLCVNDQYKGTLSFSSELKEVIKAMIF